MNFIKVLSDTVPDGRFIAFDTQTLISIGIQLLNAVVLGIVLTLILYKPVKRFLKKRSDGIQEKITNADEASQKANELIEEYQIKIAEIKKEREEIIENAYADATVEKKALIEEARVEAKKIKERSFEIISEDKKRLREEMRLYIIELSSAMAKKYVSQNIDENAQEKIYEEIMGHLEGSQWQG